MLRKVGRSKKHTAVKPITERIKTMKKIMKTIAVMCVLCLVFGTVGASAAEPEPVQYMTEKEYKERQASVDFFDEIHVISAIAGTNVVIGDVISEFNAGVKVVISYLNGSKRAGKKYVGYTDENGIFVIKTAKLRKNKTFRIDLYDMDGYLCTGKFVPRSTYFNPNDTDCKALMTPLDADDYPYIISSLKGTKVIVGQTIAGATIQLKWNKKVTESVADEYGFFRVPLKSNLKNGKEILMYVDTKENTTKYRFKSGYTGYLTDADVYL